MQEKRKQLVFALVFLCLGGLVLADQQSFERGLAYYLLGDLEKAAAGFRSYYQGKRQPALESGFRRLLANDKWESTKIFRDVLATNPRSLEALIGFNLAMSDIRDPLAVENLHRALRLNSRYAPAYLCLGFHYLQEENFPAAEKNLNLALGYTKLPEIKLFLHRLYQEMEEHEKALEAIRGEAEAQPGHVAFNLAAARSMLVLNRFNESARHIDAVLTVVPTDQEALLLRGRMLLLQDELRKARSVLEKLSFKTYHPEHMLSLTELYVRLKDRRAEQHLQELFLQLPWNSRLNYLQALFQSMRKKSEYQPWVLRAAIAGFPENQLRQNFPGFDELRVPPALPFFRVNQMAWLSDSLLLVVGLEKSGDREKLHLIDPVNLKLLRSMEYQGTAVDLHTFPNATKALLTSTAPGTNRVYLYQLVQAAGWQLQPLVGYALNAPSMLAAYSQGRDTYYLVDRRLADAAFESPFATVLPPNRRAPLFPALPLPAFSFQARTKAFQEIKSLDAKLNLPIPEIKRFSLLLDAQKAHSQIRKLVEKGEGLDVTSTEVVRTFFSDDHGSLILYLADLKNAFQAIVYQKKDNRAFNVDATMFLGRNRFSEVEVVHLDPDRQEIVLLTRDDQREIIVFNYSSLVYRKIAGSVRSVAFDPDERIIYAVCERGQKGVVSESILEIAFLEPFQQKKIDSRRDLNLVLGLNLDGRPLLSTTMGELLLLDDQMNLKTHGVSTETVLNQPAPDGSRIAAFINRRLFFFERRS